MIGEDHLQRKIRSVESLQSVVKTMKALAAVKIRQYERAVESLADYTATVEMGLQAVLRDRPEVDAGAPPAAGARVGAVVFGSDRGMCGQLNAKVVAHALDTIPESSPGRRAPMILAVGQRAADRLAEEGRPAQIVLGQADDVPAISAKVFELLARIDDWHASEGVDRVVLFHARPESGASYRPATVHLLPVDREWLARLRGRAWSGRSLPIYRMDWDRLFSSLVRQYLFAALFRALATSLASENASRLASMQGAEKSIREMLDELGRRYRSQRQAAITNELLDIVAGYEALKDDRRN